MPLEHTHTPAFLPATPLALPARTPPCLRPAVAMRFRRPSGTDPVSRLTNDSAVNEAATAAQSPPAQAPSSSKPASHRPLPAVPPTPLPYHHPVATPPAPPSAPTPRPPPSPSYSVDASLLQTSAEENLRGFIKTRGSLVPGEEFVFWWVGDIYDIRDGHSSRHMCAFEGYNIGRMVPVDGGWRMLTREVGLYKDAKTGEILDVWTNPDTGKETDCVHVWNDPVNQQFLLESDRGSFKVPTTIQGDDIYWHSEIFLKYKSPLTREQYPDHAHSDTYQSTEMFQFFSKRDDLASNEPSADCLISWVRVGQWLPWMEMADKPGKLVYHCRGRKLQNGYLDLSDSVRSYVEKHHPEYAYAPTDFISPNETSWTYMKKLLDKKGSPRADGTVAQPEPKREEKLPANTLRSDLPMVRMTSEQLAEHDGSVAERPIYLAVAGKVFDVSSARRHYRKGETYNCLTGKDASNAFISGDLSESGCQQPIDMDNLDAEQRHTLEKWIGFFSNNYPEIGSLVD